MARAIYRDTDIYLLDDPLSAVDSNVSRSIFEKVIKDFLKGKTVVLVTHQLQYLKEVDQIVCLDQGKVSFDGSFEDFKNVKETFAKMFNFSERENNAVKNNEDIEISGDNVKIDGKEKEEKREKGSVKLKVRNLLSFRKFYPTFFDVLGLRDLYKCWWTLHIHFGLFPLRINTISSILSRFLLELLGGK